VAVQLHVWLEKRRFRIHLYSIVDMGTLSPDTKGKLLEQELLKLQNTKRKNTSGSEAHIWEAYTPVIHDGRLHIQCEGCSEKLSASNPYATMPQHLGSKGCLKASCCTLP